MRLNLESEMRSDSGVSRLREPFPVSKFADRCPGNSERMSRFRNEKKEKKNVFSFFRGRGRISPKLFMLPSGINYTKIRDSADRKLKFAKGLSAEKYIYSESSSLIIKSTECRAAIFH